MVILQYSCYFLWFFFYLLVNDKIFYFILSFVFLVNDTSLYPDTLGMLNPCDILDGVATFLILRKMSKRLPIL